MKFIETNVIFVLLVNLVKGYKVLVFSPFPGISHTILGEGYVRPLVNAGHNVTYVTPILMKNPPPNLRQIDVSSNFNHFKFGNALDIDKMLKGEVDFARVDFIYKSFHDISEVAIKHDKVQKLLLDTSEEFDVAIVLWLFSEIFAGVPAVFNCPYIWSSSIEPHPMVLRLIDDIPNPAYIPDHRSPIEPPLTFTQRVGELYNIFKILKIRWDNTEMETRAFNEAFAPAFTKRGRQIPSLDEVRYNASLMFGNSHVSSGIPLRLPQNYVPIAGYHIKKEIPAMSKDLKKILDNATNGVIYFSLGSVMKAKTMPNDFKVEFLKIFSQLKQTVIWKLEEQLPNLPENVHIIEWAPQLCILAHPKTVLFITHGGLLSTTEALHYGVPLIGIPLFGDQFINTIRTVSKGFGKHVPLSYDTPRQLKIAIEEILEDSKYQDNANKLSLIYHDRPISPSDAVVHWVEHVVKTGGATHLRSIALMVPWYQKLYLDLLALVILVVILGIYIIVKIINIFSRQRKNNKSKND